MSDPTYVKQHRRGQVVSSAYREFYSLSIAAGASATEAVDLRGEMPVGVVVTSDAWTEAGIGFSTSQSPDGPFYPVCDDAGNMYVIAISDEKTMVALRPANLLMCRYLKLNSTDPEDGSAVAQEQARTIQLVTLP